MARLTRRNLAALLLAGTALLGATAAASSQGAPTRIAVITHGQAADPYWSVVKNGVDAAAKTQGADVDYRSPDTFDMVQMAQLIDAAVASKPDGLVVSTPDADALGPSRSTLRFDARGPLRYVGHSCAPPCLCSTPVDRPSTSAS